ncbi:hypothetical protein GQ44DRAFT_365042 [Phaeosphaeriaceae sp. PMI808]|nr:hypothetical protein GQ44DRAFT_365042 [Phaeosphaeriaceae sp. PMI808]
MIVGRPKSTDERVTRGTSNPALQLRYGRKYRFRVRLMDQTGGGPDFNSPTSLLGPSPISTVMFSRWIKPLAPVLVGKTPSLKDEPGAENSAEVLSLEFKRPPMAYPAILYAGYPNAMEELKAQAEEISRLPKDPRYRNAVSEPNLPDPDVKMVEITVLVQTAPQDPLAEDGPYLKLYTTTRMLPTDLKASVKVALDWQDAPNIWEPPVTWNSAATSGPLLLPTERTLRLRVNALCREEPDADKPYFGAEDVRRGPQLVVPLRKNSAKEIDLFAVNDDSFTLNGLYLQPQLDTTSRVAEAIGLRSLGPKLKGLSGKRVVFACASSLLHLIGPDRGSLTFTSHADLALRWIVVIRLELKRDWTWDGFPLNGIQVKRDGKFILSVAPVQAINEDALAGIPDRSRSSIVIIDVVDPRPDAGQRANELNLKYDISTTFLGTTQPTSDPPLSLSIRLPSTTPPTQLCDLTSVGLAMSPYTHDETYSSTSPRQQILWLSFSTPPSDPSYTYFARVLHYAPDPLLTGPQPPSPKTTPPTPRSPSTQNQSASSSPSKAQTTTA